MAATRDGGTLVAVRHSDSVCTSPMDRRVCVSIRNLFACPGIPASRTPASLRASSVNETAMILRAVRPGLWFKALPILGLYPSWNSGSSVQYNAFLERPLSIVPLREDSVMCQFSTCPNPAAFMVCNTTGSMKALCREHLISLGVAESELPKPDGQ